MLTVRGELTDEAKKTLGEGSEGEFTFVLMPMSTFRLCVERARQDGCTVADVYQRALFRYLVDKPEMTPQKTVDTATPKPAIVLRKR